MFDNIIKVFIL